MPSAEAGGFGAGDGGAPLRQLGFEHGRVAGLGELRALFS
jgi:hypothetical protein